MRSIEELSDLTFYQMDKVHQLTIDFVQEVEDLADQDLPKNESEKQEQLDRIGAMSYRVGITLEVFDPELEMDIEIIKDLETILDSRSSEIEAIGFKKI